VGCHRFDAESSGRPAWWEKEIFRNENEIIIKKIKKNAAMMMMIMFLFVVG